MSCAVNPSAAPDAAPPLVSVILPVYQGEATITQVVRSVLTQTYAHLELIVVDDGSTDATAQRLAAIADPRLRVIRQDNQGVAFARNNGFSQARGEYIAFIDADDRWLPEKLAVEMQTVEQHGQPLCIVYSRYYGVDDADRLINLSPSFTASGDALETILNNESVMLPSTALIHRQVYEAGGGFSKDCYHEDRSFFIRACRDFPAFPTQQRLTLYRQAMSGRCRRVLADYDAAIDAEFSIVSALQGALSEERLERLRRVQAKNLLYRFLMYGYMDYARRFYPRVDRSLLRADKKGRLALITMMTGINALSAARLCAQTVLRLALAPWWKTRLAQLNAIWQPSAGSADALKAISHAAV
ncbi:MAG: glycosyltransferase family 2 protein [Vampirovibrionales bacterium]|nr:glycosyltransferase family 2 protein [Vampirovibrionales bacterium]